MVAAVGFQKNYINIYEIYLKNLQQAWFIAIAQKQVLVATKSCKTLNLGSQSIGNQQKDARSLIKKKKKPKIDAGTKIYFENDTKIFAEPSRLY